MKTLYQIINNLVKFFEKKPEKEFITSSNIDWESFISQPPATPLHLKTLQNVLNMVANTYFKGDKKNAIALLELLKPNIDDSIEKIKEHIEQERVKTPTEKI